MNIKSEVIASKGGRIVFRNKLDSDCNANDVYQELSGWGIKVDKITVITTME